MALRRRDFLVSAAVLVAVFGGPPLWRRTFPSFEFAPLPGVSGFRLLDRGPISNGPVALLGIEPPDPTLQRARAEFYQSPCATLFGDVNPNGRVPVAVFSDYNCPYCYTLSERLIRLEDSGAPIRLVWYELPLLGPRSDRSARAALAAAQQGRYIDAHRYLMRNVLAPGPVGLRRMAADLDLNAAQLVRDATHADVDKKLQKASALAGALGVAGTPATIIGRTLVLGAISEPDLENLIKLEQESTPSACLN